MSCGCVGISGRSEGQKRICDVCEFYGDKEVKSVYYCDICEAYICFDCEKKYGKRFLVALVKKIKSWL